MRARRVVYGEGEEKGGKKEAECARARTGGRVGDIGSLGEDVLAGQRSGWSGHPASLASTLRG